MIRRTLTKWLGAALFVFAVAGLVVTFPPEPLLGLQMVLLAVAGLLFIVSGVTNRVRWGTLTGFGDIALGASLVVSAAATLGDQPGTGNLLYSVAISVGGLALAGIGVLYIVDHDAFDTEP